MSASTPTTEHCDVCSSFLCLYHDQWPHPARDNIVQTQHSLHCICGWSWSAQETSGVQAHACDHWPVLIVTQCTHALVTMFDNRWSHLWSWSHWHLLYQSTLIISGPEQVWPCDTGPASLTSVTAHCHSVQVWAGLGWGWKDASDASQSPWSQLLFICDIDLLGTCYSRATL